MLRSDEDGSRSEPSWVLPTRATTVARDSPSMGWAVRATKIDPARSRMTSSKSASSQYPPSQLGSGGLAWYMGQSTTDNPRRMTTDGQDSTALAREMRHLRSISER